MATTTMTDKFDIPKNGIQSGRLRAAVNTIEEARRINRAMRRQIEAWIDSAPKSPPRQRSVKARISAVVKAARSVGIDPQTVEIDGVKVSAANPTPEDAAKAAVKSWKAKHGR